LLDAVATEESTALAVVSTTNNRNGCDEEGSDSIRGCDHGLEVAVVVVVEVVADALGFRFAEEGYVLYFEV
jgi:hypothetical protein